MPNYPTNDPEVRRVIIRFRGQRIERRVKGSKTDADRYEARLRTELEQGAALEMRTAPRFSTFCMPGGRYYEHIHVPGRLRKRTLTNRMYTLATLIAHFGDARLSDIGVAEILDYQNRRLKEGVKPSTVNGEVKDLKTVLNFAKDIGAPIQEISGKRGVKNLKQTKRRVTFWTREQAKRLLDECWRESRTLHGLVMVLLNTGMRKGEALAMEWSWVDYDRGIICIPATEHWQPKDGEPRDVPLSDALRDYLKATLKRHRYVFTTNVRGERRPLAFFPQRQFDKARRAAGLNGGPHTTRHTYASHFLESHPDLQMLAAILGHSNTKVTEMYAHMVPSRLDAARNAVQFGEEDVHARTTRRWEEALERRQKARR